MDGLVPQWVYDTTIIVTDAGFTTLFFSSFFFSIEDLSKRSVCLFTTDFGE